MNPVIQMMTAIALWCGEPINTAGFTMEHRTAKEVNECRVKLHDCLEKADMSHSAETKCFAETVLK